MEDDTKFLETLADYLRKSGLYKVVKVGARGRPLSKDNAEAKQKFIKGLPAREYFRTYMKAYNQRKSQTDEAE